MSTFFRQSINRLKYVCMLSRTNRSMNILPPSFTLRDPVIHQVRKARRQGHICSLILLSIHQYDQFIRQHSSDTMQNLTEVLEHILRDTILEYVDASRLIGVKLLQTNVYGIFIRETIPFLAHETDKLAILIGKSIQTDLNFELQERDLTVQIISGATQLPSDIDDERHVIYLAVQEAWLLAAGLAPVPYNSLKQQLSQIIEYKDITVLTQPILSLQTGEVYGYEILTRGPIDTIFHSPEALFDYADRVQLLSELEFVVIQKAFEEMKSRGIMSPVFINITAVTLSHPHFERNIRRYIEKGNIEPCHVIFEITEQHLIRDYVSSSQVIRKLRSLGFRVAIDDAGAGFSSLQSILEIIPDMIKIDKSLIQQIDRVAAKESMLKAIMSFAKDIQCQVIAEGVEREEEAGVLMRHNVEMGQGFFFAKPERFMPGHGRLYLDEMKHKIHQLDRKSVV